MHTARSTGRTPHVKEPHAAETALQSKCGRPPRVFPLDGLPSDLLAVLLNVFLDGAKGHSGYPYAAFKLRLVSRQWNDLVGEFMRTRLPCQAWQWFARHVQNRFVRADGIESDHPEVDCAIRSLARFNSSDLSMLLKAQVPFVRAAARPQSHVALGMRSIHDLLALVPCTSRLGEVAATVHVLDNQLGELAGWISAVGFGLRLEICVTPAGSSEACAAMADFLKGLCAGWKGKGVLSIRPLALLHGSHPDLRPGVRAGCRFSVEADGLVMAFPHGGRCQFSMSWFGQGLPKDLPYEVIYWRTTPVGPSHARVELDTAWISTCTSLHSLELQTYSHPELRQLAHVRANMPMLRRLTLHGSAPDNNAGPVIELLQALPNLTHFKFPYGEYVGRKGTVLVKTLAGHANLESLDLRSCMIDPDDPQCLVDWIPVSKTLKTLCLSSALCMQWGCFFEEALTRNDSLALLQVTDASPRQLKALCSSLCISKGVGEVTLATTSFEFGVPRGCDEEERAVLLADLEIALEDKRDCDEWLGRQFREKA